MTTEPSGTGQKTIVVGLDGSTVCRNAVQWAAQQARLTGAHLHAVTAWQFVPADGWGVPPVAPGVVPAESYDPEQAAKNGAQAFLSNALEDEPVPGGVTVSVAEGEPGHVLVEAAANADLLVVGNRGHTAVGALLLGSTSEYCVRHARCPVLVARDTLA